ncbi:APC family permease [Amycolatopsis sp. cg5]|uniref:APC family permease n=1 Tax=Amycolatopsis sp. cg5 TaxID=3238802 RepID=UPI0035266680
MPSPSLSRRLGTRDAVIIGLGSMMTAGVFAAFAPAAQAAGSGLLIGLVLAAFVAYCNATSSARLAALYPASGGTYVYGRERLGEFWGYLAGWGFIVGKTASCAAMALTVATYSGFRWPKVFAAGAVLALTAVNYRGVQRSAQATRIIVACTLTVLTLSVVAMSSGSFVTVHPFGDFRFGGVLESAGLLFFAFAGYARIATLGEEVKDPAKTIPRAIPIALGIAFAVYAVLAVVLLSALGPDRLAAAPDPIAAAVAGTWLTPVVRVGACVAALGSLLALILGVSRTTLAMARDGHLPQSLSSVHPRFGVPHRAEVAVGVTVAVLVSIVDLRGAIGFSSFAVLVYYAIANASALTLRTRRLVPAAGLLGCLVVAFSLPLASVLFGCAVFAIGAGIWVIRRPARDKRP